MKTFLTLSLALATAWAHAQAGAITLFGGMSVQEGGRARTLGRVYFENGVPAGSMSVNFDSGELVSVRLTRIQELFIPGSTSFFTGDALASIRMNGQLRLVFGRLSVMVDDLDLEGFNFPDTIFIQFELPDGRRIVRHGTMDDGDIFVQLP